MFSSLLPNNFLDTIWGRRDGSGLGLRMRAGHQVGPVESEPHPSLRQWDVTHPHSPAQAQAQARGGSLSPPRPSAFLR